MDVGSGYVVQWFGPGWVERVGFGGRLESVGVLTELKEGYCLVAE